MESYETRRSLENDADAESESRRETKIRDLRKKNQRLEAENESLKARVRELLKLAKDATDDRVRLLKSEVSDWRRRYEDSQQASGSGSVKELEKAAEFARVEKMQMQMEMERMQADREIMKNEAKAVAKENEGLRKDLSRSRAQLEKASTSLGAYHSTAQIRMIWAGKSRMAGR